MSPEPIPETLITERVELIESLRTLATVEDDDDNHETADVYRELADLLAASPIAYICEFPDCWQVGTERTESGERYCIEHSEATP